METTDNLPDEDISSFFETQEPEEETTDEATQDDAPEAEETESDDASTDEAEVDDEEASEEDADDDDEPSEPELFTVTVDGKEKQVTLEELRSGYSGQSKIQERFREIKEAENRNRQVYEQLQAEQQRFLQFAQAVQEQGFVSPPKPPDHNLAQRDVAAYTQQLAQYNAQLQQYQQQQGQISQMREQQRKAQEAAMQSHLEEQSRVMLERIPDLADPAKAPAYRDRLVSYGEKHGYSRDEIMGVDDARAVTILDKAMRYDALQAAKSKAVKPETRNVKPKGKRPEPPQLQRGKVIARAKQADFKGDAGLAAFLEPRS